MSLIPLVSLQKPLPHLDLNDWNCRVQELGRHADKLRQDSFDFRQNSRKLRTNSRIDDEWTTRNTNLLLRERISELQHWRKSITHTYQSIQKESDILAKEKQLIDNQILALNQPIAILSECLTQRDCRLGPELTYDEADTEIKNELRLLESNQRVLIERCESVWVKLNHLDRVKFKISLEIDSKKEAESMDMEQLLLDRFAERNTYKMNASWSTKDGVDYKQWLEHTHLIKQMAVNELADTYAIRDNLITARLKANMILKAQQDRTDYALRKRIVETRRACNKLAWQQTKIRDDLNSCICEIHKLENCISSLNASLKLVETRLEKLAQRSGVELSLDQAYQGLLIESRKLIQSIRSLLHQLENTQIKFKQLTNHAEKIDFDLENKNHSVATDAKALEIRECLKNVEESKISQSDRNIELMKLDNV